MSREGLEHNRFVLVKKGYDPAETEAYIDRLEGELNAKAIEISHMSSRLETVQQQLSEYAAKEEAINRTLVEASQMRQEMLEQAEQRVLEMRRITDAQVAAKSEELLQLKQEQIQIYERIEYVLEAQLAMIRQRKRETVGNESGVEQKD